MATAIEFENVGKQYRLGLVSTRTLSHDLERWWTMNILGKEDPYLTIGETNDRATKGESEYVWALKDINFKVEQGDVVGIIGRNGAGKSTLLKLLSKVTGPTTGSIRARGRIGSLLEVGTGFHGEMTGRENIYMNGAILGMTKPEIARKLDEIIDFSGCERYIDTPVKRYSSGMTVRLGFAVAAFLDPEILVVDEVLAVGDAEFQKKAIGKMKDVSQGEGRTVLFVSHNMSSIKALCKTGVVLENGSISFEGAVSDAIDNYLKEYVIEGFKIIDGCISNISSVKFDKIVINSTEYNVIEVTSGSSIDIEICGETINDIKFDIEIRLFDNNHNLLGMYAPSHLTAAPPIVKAGHFEMSRSFNLPEGITAGQYILEVMFAQPNVEVVAYMKYPVILNVTECIAANGRNFLYKDCGLIMMH